MQRTVAEVKELCEENEFFVGLNNGPAFRELVNLISPILATVNFKVVNRVKKGKKVRSIRVNSMDANKVSMIVGYVTVDEIYPDIPLEKNFCVDAKLLGSLLGTIGQGLSIELKCPKAPGDEVWIRGYSPDNLNHEAAIILPLLPSVPQDLAIQLEAYKHETHLDLKMLKSVIRIARGKNSHADHLRFQMFESRDLIKQFTVTNLQVGTVGKPKTASVAHTFRTVARHEDYGNVVAVVDEHAATDLLLTRPQKILDNLYSTKYLNLFLRSIQRTPVEFLLAPDQPMVIVYPLTGGEKVGCCNFVLAPEGKDAKCGDDAEWFFSEDDEKKEDQ